MKQMPQVFTTFGMTGMTSRNTSGRQFTPIVQAVDTPSVFPALPEPVRLKQTILSIMGASDGLSRSNRRRAPIVRNSP